MGRKKNHVPCDGEIFKIPLEDPNFYCIGEIIKVTKKALNSVLVALYGDKHHVEDSMDVNEFDHEDIVSVIFTTPDLIQNRTWEVIGCNDPYDPDGFINYEEIAEGGFIGVQIFGSANVRSFLSAYNAMIPWNYYLRECYFDDMLYFNVKKPSDVYLQNK